MFRKEFQERIDGDRTQRRRFEDRLSLRAQRREDQFRKRRKLRDSSDLDINGTNLLCSLEKNVINHEANLEAITRLRKYLCLDTSDLKQVVEKGYVNLLLHILKSSGPSLLKAESAWCISNISAGDSYCACEIVKGGAIPILLQLLQERSREDLLDHILTCLGNLAADNITYRQQILALNGCNLLFNIFVANADQFEIILNASWTLAMLVQSQITQKQMGICLALCRQLLQVDNDELWTQAIWIVRNLFHDLNVLEDSMEGLHSSGILAAIIDIIAYPRAEIRIACLVCCEHLLRVESLIDHMLNAGLLQKLREVLKENDPQFDAPTRKSLQVETLRTLSFVPYSTQSVESILQLDLLRHIFELSKNGPFEVKREALNVVLSLLEVGSIKQVKVMVGFGVITFIRDQMNLRHPQTDELCLQCIHAVLEVGQLQMKNSAKNPYLMTCEATGIDEQVVRLSNSEVEELRDFADHILASYLS